jgi:hypothetical protein
MPTIANGRKPSPQNPDAGIQSSAGRVSLRTAVFDSGILFIL